MKHASGFISLVLVLIQIVSIQSYPFRYWPCPCQCKCPKFRSISYSQNTKEPHVYTLFVPDTKIIKQSDLDCPEPQVLLPADNTKSNVKHANDETSIKESSSAGTTNEPIDLDCKSPTTEMDEPITNTLIPDIDPREDEPSKDGNQSPITNDQNVPTSSNNIEDSTIGNVMNNNDQDVISNINNILIQNDNSYKETSIEITEDQTHTKTSISDPKDSERSAENQNIINNLNQEIAKEQNNNISPILEESNVRKDSIITPAEQTPMETIVNNDDKNINPNVHNEPAKNDETELPTSSANSNSGEPSKGETILNNNDHDMIENINSVILENTVTDALPTIDETPHPVYSGK